MQEYLLIPLCLLMLASIRLPRAVADTPADAALHRAELPEDLKEEPPTVLVVLLVRNKAHVLPLFLAYLERQQYPKDRIALWIRSDHNEDNSADILQLWLNRTASQYHDVDVEMDSSTQRYANQSSPFDWPAARFQHLIDLKESALSHAQRIWADFAFFLDVDVLLTASDALVRLVDLRLPIVAPMLLSEGLYSNFWCGMTPDFYYQRTDEYKEIYNVNKVGTFRVPMVHSAVLVHLRYAGSRYLTFDRDRLQQQQQNNEEWVDASNSGKQCRLFDGPLDDIIVFAISANCSQIPLFISNEVAFGYIMQPLEPTDDFAQDQQQLVNIRANIVHDTGEVLVLPEYFPSHPFPEKSKLTLDNIYMINLERRPERRLKMERLFEELGLDVEYFAAVDGKNLNADELAQMGVRIMPGYEDPYHHRQMTMGEIGCFLSHFRLWERIVERNEQEVLILEDDIRFEPYFRERAERVLNEARQTIKFDLLYFGRKRLKDEREPWVRGADNLVHVGYSYWTLGYVITLEGAKKLLAAKPLHKLIPVDEFLPVMFDRHPNKTLLAEFPQRDLVALSAAPLIMFPIHYTGEDGYISDTEDSELTSPVLISDSAPQLKSDRELEFAWRAEPDPMHLSTSEQDELLKEELSAYKIRDEF